MEKLKTNKDKKNIVNHQKPRRKEKTSMNGKTEKRKKTQYERNDVY